MTCNCFVGGDFLVEENQDVITRVSNQGDTDVLVCNSKENHEDSICMDLGNESQSENTESLKQLTSEKSMLDNNTYNLMEQLTIENRSLWRIKNNYKNDAATDNESEQLWSRIEKDKEELVKLLTEKLRERL